MSLRDRVSPYHVYWFISVGLRFGLQTAFTVSMVYQVEKVGLGPFQLLLVGTVLEATAFICEIPTGIVADVYSRRLSVIIGYFLLGSGVMLMGAVPRFEALLVAMVITGLGGTFMSGAEEAWIADEIGEARVGPVFVRGSQLDEVGRLAGTVVSVALASISLSLAIISGGVFVVAMGIVLIAIMPEHGFRPAPREERSSFQQMGHTFHEGTRMVRRRPVLITILGIAAFFGMFNEGFDRLWTAHFLESFQPFPSLGPLDPIVWFGIFSVCVTLLSIGALEFVRRRVNMESHIAVTRTMFGINAALIVSVLAFAFSGSFLVAMLTYFAASTLRQIVYPLTSTWVNQSVDSRVRATVLSMTGQADALGQILGGPVVGAIGSLASIRAALATAGLALVPGLGLYVRALGQEEPLVVVEVGEEEPVLS